MTSGAKIMTLGTSRGRESTISAGFAKALVDLAATAGAAPSTLLARAGLDPMLLADQDNRVSFAAYKTLMRAAKELTGDPALALHFGEAFEMTSLSIVGHIGMACENWAQAFEQLGRYTQLVIDIAVDSPDGKRFVIERVGGKVWLTDTRRDPNDFPELTESSFARMAAAAHTRRSGIKVVREIHVTHEAPSYSAEYERVFELPVVFESDRNALLMKDDSFLATPTPNPSRYVFGVFSARADRLLQELETDTTARGRVESLLIPMLHTGVAGMDVVASKMALTRRTLARRLKAEGTSFEKVLDELRHRMALDYLDSRKVSVTETAYLTGFSDPAAFTRAFKRWEGVSPTSKRPAVKGN
jgi:AraC-like DNA-binding protein